ncbi:MAG TPA: SDR family oxidoreductase [Thermoleophilaceae bacterium]
MSGALFLTGGTGFLGMELIARMLEAGDGPDIYVAIRADDPLAAQTRLAETVGRLWETPPESIARLRAVRADLTAPGLGLTASVRDELAANVERVVHCAASIAFTLPLAEARGVNVEGTRRVLELAADLPRLERVVHVSTAYVSGRTPDVFDESHPGGSGFRNTYERTKMEAEVAVRASGLPYAIVRPSIVVGEAASGWTAAFNVLYWPLQAFARGLLPLVPADPDGIVDMVPVDYVAEVIERATFEPGATGCFHAVAGERAILVRDLIAAVCSELSLEAPELTPPNTLPDGHPAEIFAPYFDVNTRFDDSRAQKLVSEPAPEPVTYLPQLLEFAQAARWGKSPITREAARLLAAARS